MWDNMVTSNGLDTSEYHQQPLKAYTKPPLSYKDQIRLLESRGMIFEDSYAALNLIEHINYYRLEAYWFTYYDKNKQEHCFLPDTTFSNIWRDYRFDRKFRELILHALERIEISFKTQFTYSLSHHYGSFPLKKNNFKFSQMCWEENIKELKQICSVSKEQFAIHLRETYSCEIFPIWAVTELMSFGKVSLFYKNIKDQSMQKSISRKYGIQPEILISWLNHLSNVRNYCAHHARLWNRRFVHTPKEALSIRDDIKGRWISLPENPEKDDPRNERRVFNTLLIIDYLLSNICSKYNWKKELVQLISKYKIDEKRMGFPDNWRNDSFWIEEEIN
ncbi:MAG: Abi family protein [Peptostreptococcaceae bacterium]|nr:Abi family protein [Peptostreptococcaceae bacterium]